ncbi:MAG: DUF1801 domain-containing protein [Candidatus Doudnabacteria bacterium]
MAEIKTKATKASVMEFLKSVKPEDKQKDGLALLKMFKKITGEKPVMWGTSIVGFGKYHYKSVSSEGEWFEVGFSPRKQNLTLYILAWKQENPALAKLGKYKRGGGCLYVNRLSDVDEKVLASLIKTVYTHRKKIHQ